MSYFNTKNVVPVFLAPMDGYTDIAFRQAFLEEVSYPVTRVFTEFINVESIIRSTQESQKSLLLSKDNGKFNTQTSVQLFGKNPESFYQAVKHVLELGYKDIDINLGCSVNKVIKNGEGGALIGEYDTVGAIIKKSKEAIAVCAKASKQSKENFKLSVKTRLGFHSDISEEWLKFLDSQNLDFITLHGRIVSQGFKGHTNWGKIGEIAEKISTPLIGNGDINSVDEAELKYKKYNLQGVMLGRFAQCILDYKLLNEKATKKRFLTCLKYLKIHEKLIMPMFKSEYDAIISTRKVLLWFLKGIENTAKLRIALLKSETYQESLKLLQNYD